MNALGTAVYVAVIASFLFYAPRIFGTDTPKDTVLVPFVMLLLLVLSVAITGSLVFGRPMLWYLDGRKKEALRLFAYTLGALFIIIILAGCVLYAVGF